MNLTFSFLVIVCGATGNDCKVFAMDTGMSGADCIDRAVEYQPTAVAMGWTTQCEVEPDQ